MRSRPRMSTMRRRRSVPRARSAWRNRSRPSSARVAFDAAIDAGLAEPDRQYRWDNLPIADWADGDMRELARRTRSGRRVRLELGQIGTGDRRVFWCAALPIHQYPGYPIVAGYARGSARRVMRELGRRGYIEAYASHDIRHLSGCWPAV